MAYPIPMAGIIISGANIVVANSPAIPILPNIPAADSPAIIAPVSAPTTSPVIIGIAVSIANPSAAASVVANA